MKSKGPVLLGRLEVTVGQEGLALARFRRENSNQKPEKREPQLLKQSLIIQCPVDEKRYGSYIFETRRNRWMYTGWYPPGARMLDIRNANLKVSNNVYALNVYEHVPEELNSFLETQSKGRLKSEIVLKFNRVDGHCEMKVTDISSHEPSSSYLSGLA